MLVAADSLPVPSGAGTHRDTVSNSPLRLDRTWTDARSLEDACRIWADVYRGWVAGQQLGAVTGEIQEGVACNYAGETSGMQTALGVAKYGNEPVQVTLSIIR